MKFVIENSGVPIYQRINLALSEALKAAGHSVHLYTPAFADDREFVQHWENSTQDVYIITNEKCVAQKHSESYAGYLFEHIQMPMVFLCHDNLFCGTGDFVKTRMRYQSLLVVQDRAVIFCIEKSNIEDLRSIGFKNVHYLPHATEFQPLDGPVAREGVTFVGHTMRGLATFPREGYPFAEELLKIAQTRLRQQSTAVQPIVSQMLNIQDPMDAIACKLVLLNLLNRMTFSMRGDMLSGADYPITVVGGDLSYGSGSLNQYRFESEKIQQITATQNYAETASTYAKSKISINITGLQFDTAVTNRVFDVVAADGVVLTDRRSDFLELFPYAEALCFDSPEELHDRLMDAENPACYGRYQEICKTIQMDLFSHYSYINVVNAIVLQIDRL